MSRGTCMLQGHLNCDSCITAWEVSKMSNRKDYLAWAVVISWSTPQKEFSRRIWNIPELLPQFPQLIHSAISRNLDCTRRKIFVAKVGQVSKTVIGSRAISWRWWQFQMKPCPRAVLAGLQRSLNLALLDLSIYTCNSHFEHGQIVV